MNFETKYLDLLNELIVNGRNKSDRTGIGTKILFGAMIRHDLSKGFPLLTTKKVHFKSVVHELLWFLKGDTNTEYLEKNGVSIWNEWKDDEGNLGRVYGAQWRRWRIANFFDSEISNELKSDYYKGSEKTPHGKRSVYSPKEAVNNWYEFDQISDVIEEIKSNPNSRRLLVSAWNVADIPNMALPPCHYAFQFEVCDGKLSCMFQMRSVDTLLGLPFNMASYALLTYMVAQVCDLEVGDLIWVGGDVHLYNNHFEQAKEQLSRMPYDMPTISLNQNIKNIFDFKFEDIVLENYNAHPPIKAPVAV